MIVRHSQNIRPPERKPTAFGLALAEALEAARIQKETK
jgi:hypothetical protein